MPARKKKVKAEAASRGLDARRLASTNPPANVAELAELRAELLDALGEPRLEVFIRPRDKHQLLAGLNHSANRITAGLLLASLIVGAALLMRVPTEFQLFGYPGLAIICFLLAATGGVILLANIVFQDRKHKRRARELWP